MTDSKTQYCAEILTNNLRDNFLSSYVLLGYNTLSRCVISLDWNRVAVLKRTIIRIIVLYIKHKLVNTISWDAYKKRYASHDVVLLTQASLKF